MLKQKLKTKHTIRKAGYAPVKCLKSQLYNRPPMHIPLGAVLNCFGCATIGGSLLSYYSNVLRGHPILGPVWRGKEDFWDDPQEGGRMG